MLTFIVTEYEDHTYRVETKHIAYHFRDGLLIDNIDAQDLPEALQQIRQTVEITYGEKVTFKAA